MCGDTRFCRVWLGFAGFWWFWICGFGLVVGGILAGVVGFGCGLRAYGVKKGLFVGVLGAGLG